MFSVGVELEKALNKVLLLSVNPESVEEGFQGTSKEKEKPGGVLHHSEDLLECGRPRIHREASGSPG